jgi:hypothetical protein
VRSARRPGITAGGQQHEAFGVIGAGGRASACLLPSAPLSPNAYASRCFVSAYYSLSLSLSPPARLVALPPLVLGYWAWAFGRRSFPRFLLRGGAPASAVLARCRVRQRGERVRASRLTRSLTRSARRARVA